MFGVNPSLRRTLYNNGFDGGRLGVVMEEGACTLGLLVPKGTLSDMDGRLDRDTRCRNDDRALRNCQKFEKGLIRV